MRGRWRHRHGGGPGWEAWQAGHGGRDWHRWMHHRPRIRRLQARLFFWFSTAIVTALFAGAVTLWTIHAAEPQRASTLATRTMADRLAREWDDPEQCDRYVAHVHDLIGLDVRLRRDVHSLPHRLALRGGIVTFGPRGEAFLPVIRNGELVGAVEFDASGGPAGGHMHSMFVALGASLVVLALAARAVARRLSWPLEDVADAAERFGGGDLSARTRVGGRRRWVATEVSEVAQAFDQMAERIERVVRDQRELLAAISHELRSPLGRARVALEITRDRAGDAATPSLDDIERQLTDVDAILGDLLAAARAGLSDVKPVATPIVAWLRARLAAEPTPPILELVTDARDDLTLAIDAPLLNRALHNIVTNACAHGHPETEPIEVTLTADAQKVRIVARDRGPGFPEDILPRAFEPFVKGGDAARTPGKGGGGYGLGLSLVRRIAEAHGGSAFARNAPPAPDGKPGGAEVGIELPREKR